MTMIGDTGFEYRIPPGGGRKFRIDVYASDKPVDGWVG